MKVAQHLGNLSCACIVYMHLGLCVLPRLSAFTVKIVFAARQRVCSGGRSASSACCALGAAGEEGEQAAANATAGFVKMLGAGVCRGRYAPQLIKGASRGRVADGVRAAPAARPQVGRGVMHPVCLRGAPPPACPPPPGVVAEARINRIDYVLQCKKHAQETNPT